MTEPTLSERMMRVALLGVVPADDQHVIADAQEEIDNLRRGDDHHQEERAKLEAEVKRLRERLEPFAEIARRIGWDKIADDDMQLGEHVIEAPADDIKPGATYCLMVGAFREAAKAIVAEQSSRHTARQESDEAREARTELPSPADADASSHKGTPPT